MLFYAASPIQCIKVYILQHGSIVCNDIELQLGSSLYLRGSWRDVSWEEYLHEQPYLHPFLDEFLMRKRHQSRSPKIILIYCHEARWCLMTGRGYTQTQRATSTRLPLKSLSEHIDAWPFQEPVDSRDVPGYYDIKDPFW